MPSSALSSWQTTARSELDELETAHVRISGSGPGRRYATRQLNHAYTMAVAGQFPLATVNVRWRRVVPGGRSIVIGASAGQPSGHAAGGGGAASERALEPPRLLRGHV